MTRHAAVVVIGEGMLELAKRHGAWSVGWGGDAVNVAVHLARFGDHVEFITALGADPISEELRTAWASEGVGTRHILTDLSRGIGIYAVHLNRAGERHFTYWRAHSAARRLFSLEGVKEAIATAETAQILYLSLISLAVLPSVSRDRLATLCRTVRRNGGRVAFDSNYRPALWHNRGLAQEVASRFIGMCDIGFPTLEDEVGLFGRGDADAVVARWRGAGVQEVAVKLGGAGCLLAAADEEPVLVACSSRLVQDASGAGDAFNAGYLHARQSGEEPSTAALCGHQLAGWVVERAGALPPRDAAAPYKLL
jgi:2-dehydro-3-deoxygluconokinase